MTDTLAETLSKYRPAAGIENVIRAHGELQTGLTPDSLAEMYARDGQPPSVADYLPFTNLDPSQKAKLLIQAHLGQAERLSQLASSEDHPVLVNDYNRRAAAERQQADHLTQILSQLSSSSG